MDNNCNLALFAHYQEHLRYGKIEAGCQHGTGHAIKKVKPDPYSSTENPSFGKYFFISWDEMNNHEHHTKRNY